MKTIWAIATIGMRNAVRSRVVVVLLGLLVLAIFGLPLTIKGDGTLTGQVQILLNYALGSVRVILSIATVWAGCAAVSQEVQERQIHLVLAKPVHRGQVWAGKWLALLVINAALLGLCGGIIYAALRWTTRPAVLTAAQQQALREEILVARRSIKPAPVDVEGLVRQQMEQRRASGTLPPDVAPDQVYQAMKQVLLAQAYAVPTGYKRRWTFALPAKLAANEPLVFRYQFSAAQMGDVSVSGLWLIGPADRAERREVRQTSVAGVPHSFSVPAAVAGASRTLVVEYANLNPVPMTVLFSPEDGLELLVHEGGFAGNFGRSLLVVFCQLAFLGALAVTAGALVSLPVAALATGYLVLLLQIGNHLSSLAASAGPFFGSATKPTVATTVLDGVLRLVLKLENAAIQPLREPNPLEFLAMGRLVDWWWVGGAVLIKVIVYSGCLAVAGTWLFNRREIGLPA